MKFKSFSISLPWGMGGITLDANEVAERAAWSLYVELNTRVAMMPLNKGEGSVRGALASLYSLFEVTREVLKEGGVDVAKAERGHQSLGSIAMSFLNDVVRPDLGRWHASLTAYEGASWQRLVDSGLHVPADADVAGALIDETAWTGYEAFYSELEEMQKKLGRYVLILGALAGAIESPDVKPKPG